MNGNKNSLKEFKHVCMCVHTHTHERTGLKTISDLSPEREEAKIK